MLLVRASFNFEWYDGECSGNNLHFGLTGGQFGAEICGGGSPPVQDGYPYINEP